MVSADEFEFGENRNIDHLINWVLIWHWSRLDRQLFRLRHRVPKIVFFILVTDVPPRRRVLLDVIGVKIDVEIRKL